MSSPGIRTEMLACTRDATPISVYDQSIGPLLSNEPFDCVMKKRCCADNLQESICASSSKRIAVRAYSVGKSNRKKETSVSRPAGQRIILSGKHAAVISRNLTIHLGNRKSRMNREISTI
jgi:hypothetical protein